jgi:SAM-dependent methyltransferase
MALCRAGHRVHGFDLSHHLLRDFQEHADGSVPLVRGDMRALAYRDGSFDAVLSLFTSFGYFEDDDANWQVLREAARVLRPGGRFLLDFLNALRVRADLRPHSARTLPSGLEVVETRQIDESRRGVVKTVELRRGGKSLRRWEETVRLHTREELTAALAASGLKVSWVCGDFDGSPHGAQSSRLILLATLA